MSNPYTPPVSALKPPASTQMRSTMKLKRVGVLSVGLFSGAAGMLIGLFAGGLAMIMSMIGGVAANNPQAAGMALGMGFLAIIISPLIYGVLGFIGGLLQACIYNIVAGMSGGIEMEFGRD